MEEYHRLADRLKDYWERLKGASALPLERQIDPEDLHDIWDDCFLVQMPRPEEYFYDFLGKHLIEAYGESFMSDAVDFLVSPHTHRATRKFHEVFITGQPLTDDGEFTNASHLQIKYRQLLLPFGTVSADGKVKVTNVLGGMRWKMV